MESPSPELITMPASLEDVQVTRLPKSAFYISEFINREEEELLLNKVCEFRSSSGYRPTDRILADIYGTQTTMETTHP
jgi:hypothetical protein